MGLLRAEPAECAEGADLPEDESFPPLPSVPPFFLWIDDTPRPGWANMAIDLALLDLAELHGESWLRLYTWSPHCLSFGRHEPAATRYDAERIRSLGLDTVRRPTGGRAVWHARELTYAIAAPGARFGSLPQAYLKIHRLLGRAIRSLGIPTSLAPLTRRAALDTGACFSHAVGGEVLVGGRKVVGSAQLRRGSALLQHGSILLHDDQRLVSTVMRGLEFAWRTSSPPPGLAVAARTPLLAAEVAAAVGQAAELEWGTCRPPSGGDRVLRTASSHYPQFRSPTWTWTR